jgi:heme o synthase
MQAQFTDTDLTECPTWRDYLAITKPGTTAVLVLTAVASMFIAAEGLPPATIVIAAALGVYLAASGACAINSYLDRDIDAVMTRTRYRPLPANRMLPRQALQFGLGLIALSFVILMAGTNWVAAGLQLLSVILYTFFYTYILKRRSIYSTFIGATAGAIAALVGWAAVKGGLSIEALVLFAILLYWSSAYSWSTALLHRNEYVKAAVPVMPVIQGPNSARIQIGRYSVLIVVLTLLPVGMGLLDKYYAFIALPLGIFFVYTAVQLHLSPTIQNVLRYHKHSMLYLALLLAAMLADRAIL